MMWGELDTRNGGGMGLEYQMLSMENVGRGVGRRECKIAPGLVPRRRNYSVASLGIKKVNNEVI